MLLMIFSQQRERGSAAIAAVIAMIVLGLLGTAFVTLSTSELRIATSYRDGVSAQYLAEAGALWARIQLRSDVDKDLRTYPDGDKRLTKTENKIPGSYTVTISRDKDNPDLRKIVSVGTVNGAKRTVSLEVNLKKNPISILGMPAGGAWQDILDVCIFSGLDMNISNNTIYGNIRSDGNIFGDSNQTYIKTANFPVMIGTYSVPVGKTAMVKEGNPKVPTELALNLPPLTNQRSSYQGNAVKTYSTTTTTLSGTYTSTTMPPGIHFFYGDLIVANNTRISVDGVIFYVIGNVTLSNNASMGKTLVLSENNIIVNNGAVFLNTLLVADKNITLKPNSVIGKDPVEYNSDGTPKYGGIAVARGSVIMQNNAKITYNAALVAYFSTGAVTSWSNLP